MKCLIASLCVMALAALPAGASANSGSEVASAKRIVIAYLPERLQLRVPGSQRQYQNSPTLPRGTEVEQVADASGGLEWDMRAPEPTTIQQPNEAASPEPIVIAYIPGHLQHRVPGHQHKHQASTLPSPKPSAEQVSPKKERSRGARAGIAIGAIVGGSAVIFGISAAVFIATY